MSDPTPPRYLKPMNKIVMGLQKLGIQTGPAMVLTAPGRKSGQPRSTPMSPFEFQGQLYTVAGFPRADWALNARAAGAGTLYAKCAYFTLTPVHAAPTALYAELVVPYRSPAAFRVAVRAAL